MPGKSRVSWLLWATCLLMAVKSTSEWKKIEEGIEMLEGDVAVYRFRQTTKLNENRVEFHLYGITRGNDLKSAISISDSQVWMAVEGSWIENGIRTTHLDADESHWCEFHVRVRNTGYQVFYEHTIHELTNPIFMTNKREEYNYPYVRQAAVQFNHDGLFNIRPTHTKKDIKSDPFLFHVEESRVQDKTPVKVHIGQVLYLEMFIGDNHQYYWNKDVPTIGIAYFELIDGNDVPILQIELNHLKGLEVIVPRNIQCGYFMTKKNTILRLYVEVLDYKYIIRSDDNEAYKPNRVGCEVEIGPYGNDPNDIAGFVVRGDADPLRFAFLEHKGYV